MAAYSVWGLLRKLPGGEYFVRVCAIAPHEVRSLADSDVLTDVAPTIGEAVTVRDRLVVKLTTRLVKRGDTVVAVDFTDDE